MARKKFNARKVKPQERLSAIPAGEYVAAIVDSGYFENKKGTGGYLKFKLRILDGEYKGRIVFENAINIVNESKEAQTIAQSQLSAIAHAVNVLDVYYDDTLKTQSADCLHDIPMTIEIGQEEYNNRTVNRILAYLPLEDESEEEEEDTEEENEVEEEITEEESEEEDNEEEDSWSEAEEEETDEWGEESEEDEEEVEEEIEEEKPKKKKTSKKKATTKPSKKATKKKGSTKKKAKKPDWL
jgi:flagellar biosynthesis GTPase FlhF